MTTSHHPVSGSQMAGRGEEGMKASEERQMRFAYADPPYLGCSAKLYGDMHPHAADYDDPESHRELVTRLCDEFTDGWAMSLSSPSLQTILPMCPADVRVMAWVKPFCAFKAGVTVAYAWEPVIVRGGRKRPREMPTVRDWVSEVITLKKGCPGAKPAGFVRWLLDVLNVQPTDEFVDLFPGSGAVESAWQEFRRSPMLPLRYESVDRVQMLDGFECDEFTPPTPHPTPANRA